MIEDMQQYYAKDDSRCYATINLARLLENCRVLKRLAGSKMMVAVVKADGYGHGAVQVAKTLSGEVEMFAVSTAGEALQLRAAGITDEILVLGFVPKQKLKALATQNIVITAYDADYARQQAQVARQGGFTLRTHLKINSGMNRLGLSAENIEQITALLELEGLHFEGVFTHLAVADGESEGDREFTADQQRRFIGCVESLKKAGFNPKYIHSENTAGTAFCGFDICNMVRCGIGLYGYPPDVTPIKGLKPVMQLYARVAQCRTLKVGEAISYGRTFVAERPMRVAVVTAGYADGYTRLLSGKAVTEVAGRAAPVIGRVCMDYLFIDITDINGVEIGDAVRLIGDAPALDAQQAAEKSGKICYELLCGISPRVIRIYDKEYEDG